MPNYWCNFVTLFLSLNSDRCSTIYIKEIRGNKFKDTQQLIFVEKLNILKQGKFYVCLNFTGFRELGKV